MTNKLSERMALPIDSPLTAPVMTISESWYLAKLKEVGELEEGLEEIRQWAQHPLLKVRHSEVLLVVERMCDEALAGGDE